MKMIFKYELRFVALTLPSLWSLDLSLFFIVLVGRNVVSGSCKSKPHSLTHSLTDSLVDLPLWGLATADDHSDIFLLHCARSCDISFTSFSWMYSQPVHSSMSCIHCLLGLPWCRDPSVIPSRTVSANYPALPRVMWPTYCSFSFATLPINSLSRPNSLNIESFVMCSCHEMLSIFLQHHISKASILFLSDFFKVHPSAPYWNTAHVHHWLRHFDFRCSFYISVFPDTGQYNSLFV